MAKRKTAKTVDEAASADVCSPNSAKAASYENYGIALGIAVLVFAVYSRVLSNDFIAYDDEAYVTKNDVVRAGLTPHGIYYALTGICVSNWHPLTMLSHMLDCTLFGLRPWGHHLSSLLLHTLNAVLLFALLLTMTRCKWRSAAVALLFGVHPLHVASVAQVSLRKDVLSGLFWVLALLAYARYVQSSKTRPYVIALACLALGLLSKPMLVTLPVIMLALDLWPLNRFAGLAPGAWRGRLVALIREKGPFFALAIVMCAITILVQHTAGAVNTADERPISLRVQNALVSYAAYLIKTVLPLRLAIFYPYPHEIAPTLVIGAALFFAVCTWLAYAAWRRFPYVTVGWLWYVVSLAPVIGIIQVGDQAMADRYTYLPLIGPFIALVWGMGDALHHSPRWRVPAALVGTGTGLVMAGLAWINLGCWRNNHEVWEHALDVTRDSFVAHMNMGVELAHEGELENAVQHFGEALRLDGQSRIAHENLAMAYEALAQRSVKQHDHAGAISLYTKAIEANPTNPKTRLKLGNVYMSMHDFESASTAYAEAIRLDPQYAGAHYNLALVLENGGRLAEAESELRAALELQPGLNAARDELQRVQKLKAKNGDSTGPAPPT